jgi:hypothetical protein
VTTQTLGSTSTIEATEIDPTTGDPRLSHIIPPKDGVEGHVRAFEARIEGTPIEALCGHVLVPTRDPKQYPNCQRCIEVFKADTGHDDGFRDS